MGIMNKYLLIEGSSSLKTRILSIFCIKWIHWWDKIAKSRQNDKSVNVQLLFMIFPGPCVVFGLGTWSNDFCKAGAIWLCGRGHIARHDPPIPPSLHASCRPPTHYVLNGHVRYQNWSIFADVIELDDGTFNRKALYLMVRTMVSG